MNPACDACKGACCETLVLDLPDNPEVSIWLELRGRREGSRDRPQVRIAAPCSCLHAGKCTIYSTRPEPCRVFAVGSPSCISAIRTQRPKDASRLIKLAREHQPTNQSTKETI